MPVAFGVASPLNAPAVAALMGAGVETGVRLGTFQGLSSLSPSQLHSIETEGTFKMSSVS